MDATQLRYILEELHFSSAFPADVLDYLATESTLQQIAAGGVLFREGTTNEKLYLVRSGRLVLEMNIPGRGVVSILTLGPGA